MHVHAEDQLAPRDVLQLVDEVAVPVARRDALALEQRERMRPGRAEAAALLARDVRDVAAQLRQRAHHVRGRPADRRRHLEHRLHQLGVEARLVLAVLDGGEHGVDVLHEIPRLGVEQHVLLLDAERVRIALAERVVEHARVLGARPERALAGDRRREDLLHDGSITASASISTSQRGSSSCGDDAGRRRPRPCERLAVRAADVVDERGVGDVDPRADDVVEARRRPRASARSMISRQTFAWSYGVAGGSASPGMIGAVPETQTRSPMRTARE